MLKLNTQSMWKLGLLVLYGTQFLSAESITPLGKKMGLMNLNFNLIESRLKEPEKNAAALTKLIGELKTYCKDAKDLVPAKVKDIPAQLDAWNGTFDRMMDHLAKMEQALKDKKYDQLAGEFVKVDEEMDAGHHAFRPKKKKGE